ncbi:MAG: hypothetical protein CVV23_07385 [Ignavibacteriae bacterium HGW-Ignavibacteriae-2]|jgi:AcrR family transcriptional regulator|nr:MAG: hypothetical protein CVV23_07385 [Ignavibacteriae bacterium HGW-Ignavibacteriae-2]
MTKCYDDKKQQVINAAIKAIARYGFHKTTLEDIASQMGIKKNSLYYYFPSKEALFDEIIRGEAEVITTALKSISAKETTISKKMTEIFKRLVYYSRERSSLYAISLETFLEIGEIIHGSFNEIAESIVKIIEDILKDGVKQGILKKHNCNEVAENLFQVLSSLEYKEYHYYAIKSFEDVDLDKLEKRITLISNLVIDGLKLETTKK